MTREFIPWFGLPQRHPYIHVVEALTKSIASSNQVSSVNTIMVTFILLSTKELLHRGWGSPRAPHKIIDAAPHQAGGSLTCRRDTKAPRMAGAPRYNVGSLKNQPQGTTPCLLAHSRDNLALTLLKLVLNLRI